MIIMTNSNGIGIWLTCSQSDCSQLFTIVPRVHWSQFQKVKMKRGAAEKNVSGWIIFNKTIIYIKGILWEIYECVSEVLSHLGRMFGVIFRVQRAQKSPKSGKTCLTILYRGFWGVPHQGFGYIYIFSVPFASGWTALKNLWWKLGVADRHSSEQSFRLRNIPALSKRIDHKR